MFVREKSPQLSYESIDIFFIFEDDIPDSISEIPDPKERENLSHERFYEPARDPDDDTITKYLIEYLPCTSCRHFYRAMPSLIGCKTL